MPKTNQFNIRLSEDLWDWLSTYCAKTGRSKTSTVEELLLALQRGEIALPQVGADPFPAEREARYPLGDHPDFPVLVFFARNN